MPHITLGTENFLLISTEMFDLLQLSDQRGFIFIENQGRFYIAGKDLPDAFKVTKYPQKYNYTHNSSTLAFWLREKFGYKKIIMIVKGRSKTIEGLVCWPLSVKEGIKRRAEHQTYNKMKDSAG